MIRLKCVLSLVASVFLMVVQVWALPQSDANPKPSSRAVYLVASEHFLQAMRDEIPPAFRPVSRAEFPLMDILAAVRKGASIVWVGDGKLLPKEMWIGTFRPAAEALTVTVAKNNPLLLKSLVINKSRISSGYIKPTVALTYHNIVEEPRADLLPILEARDRFGQVVGYPGILMRYYAPSLVGQNFSGSECFGFFFEKPLEAMPAGQWKHLLNALALHFSSSIQITWIRTNFASYRSGEWVSIRAAVHNTRPHAVATELHFSFEGPTDKEFHAIDTVRRCPEGNGFSEAAVEFKPPGPAGLWKIRVEAYEDIHRAEELAVRGNPVAIDRREIGIVVLTGPLNTPTIVSTKGENLEIEGKDGFWAGTNYYPSSSWWDWLWRDFQPLKASGDFAAMRRTGYRIVRMWVDPVLDEQSLRAMDAAIYLAAQHGIVLDICIFTQWVRYVGYENQQGQITTFDFRHMDFNIYGISFRNLTLQERYVSLLANRWRRVGNIIYDLSNEPAVNDPDPSQIGKEALQWHGIPSAHGTSRDTLLFRHWADVITGAIRKAGGEQPIIPGDFGYGDSYLGERNGEIESWHAYMDPQSVGASLSYVDPACSERPMLLEEFGTRGWNDEPVYDGIAHFALGAGAAAAMSYEWGISWLAPEMSFYPTPLREAAASKSPDPRWFKPAISVAKSWSARSPGIFPAPSGFLYGTVYSGTPFPAAAAIVLGRLGIMGQDLSRSVKPERVYVLVPTAASGKKGAMSATEETIQELWKEKVPFATWQQDCLEHLPGSARVLIVPAPQNAELSQKLEKLSQKGIKVFARSNNTWKNSRLLPRLSVKPSNAQLLIRRTIKGTLYFLVDKEPAAAFTLETEGHERITAGLSRYAMIHEHNSAIDLVEASGDVDINGTRFCQIERGRAIIRSTDDSALSSSSRIRLMVTRPTPIRFERKIQRVDVLEAGRSKPVASFRVTSESAKVIQIDDELARYVVQVEF